jgi:hypothetical protein
MGLSDLLLFICLRLLFFFFLDNISLCSLEFAMHSRVGLELLEVCLPLPISAGAKGENHHSWLVAYFLRSTLCYALRGRTKLPTWPWSLKDRVYWGSRYMNNYKGKKSYQDGVMHFWESPELSILRVKVYTFSHPAVTFFFYSAQIDRILVGPFVCLLVLI